MSQHEYELAIEQLHDQIFELQVANDCLLKQLQQHAAACYKLLKICMPRHTWKKIMRVIKELPSGEETTG